LTGQDIFAFSYVVAGLALASAPIAYVILRQRIGLPDFFGRIPRSALLIVSCLLVVAGIVILDSAVFLGGSLLLSVVIARFTPKDRLRALLLSLAAIGAAGTLFWWKYDDAHRLTVENSYLAYFFILAVAISLIALIPNKRSFATDMFILLIVTIFILQHSANMSVLLDDGVYTAIRHHWGAYIGPSETVLSGARILYDIPAQYGFGPTLLIASACGTNCWIGMYWITTAASVIYALLIVASANVIARKVENAWTYGAILFAAAAACMLWTSYPPQLGGPWSFPSTGGLRFIPLAALLLFVLWSETRSAESRPSRFYGHALWCLGAVWAPEAAFYLSFVWWPYLLWRESNLSARPFRAAALAGLEIVAVASALAAVFVSLFYLIYGVVPSFDVYVAYVVNPTGPQPPNPLGSVWFFAFTMIAGISAAASLARMKSADSEFASLFVCILALFAVFSYYIGRSHDNNILNLMPFIVLVLVAVQSFATVPALSQSARVALASILASVIFFGWSAWRQTALSDYANAGAAAAMSYVRGQSAEQTGAAAIKLSDVESGPEQSRGRDPGKSRLDGANPADASRAVFYVSSVRGEPLIKIDDGLDMAPIGPRAWSAIHDPIDFYFLPDSLVAKLIDRTMRRLNSPGWLVIAKHVDNVPETLRWQRLLEASYIKTEEMDFGAYHAIRYEPNVR
jgi:hypothetical protein